MINIFSKIKYLLRNILYCVAAFIFIIFYFIIYGFVALYEKFNTSKYTNINDDDEYYDYDLD